MMASAAVLAAQHFPREVDDWEGLPAVDVPGGRGIERYSRSPYLQCNDQNVSRIGTRTCLPSLSSTVVASALAR